MKQILLIFLLLSSITLSAQQFYVDVQLGNGFATNAGQANLTDISIIDTVSTYEIIAGGFGEGLYFSSNIGYTWTSYLSFELGLSYLSGRTITQEQNISSSTVFGGFVGEAK